MIEDADLIVTLSNHAQEKYLTLPTRTTTVRWYVPDLARASTARPDVNILFREVRNMLSWKVDDLVGRIANKSPAKIDHALEKRRYAESSL